MIWNILVKQKKLFDMLLGILKSTVFVRRYLVDEQNAINAVIFSEDMVESIVIIFHT